jgi:hypothetical protein
MKTYQMAECKLDGDDNSEFNLQPRFCHLRGVFNPSDISLLSDTRSPTPAVLPRMNLVNRLVKELLRMLLLRGIVDLW